MSLLPCACHIQTELFTGGLRRIEFADDLTFVHNKDAVRNAQNFFEFEGDQKDGLACISLGDQLSVDVFDSAYVKSAGGLDGDQEFRVFLQLTGDDGLLLVAAGHGADDRDRTRFRKPAPLLKSGEKYLCRTMLYSRE